MDGGTPCSEEEQVMLQIPAMSRPSACLACLALGNAQLSCAQHGGGLLLQLGHCSQHVVWAQVEGHTGRDAARLEYLRLFQDYQQQKLAPPHATDSGVCLDASEKRPESAKAARRRISMVPIRKPVSSKRGGL
jgi:hypothetical protein